MLANMIYLFGKPWWKINEDMYGVNNSSRYLKSELSNTTLKSMYFIVQERKPPLCSLVFLKCTSIHHSIAFYMQLCY